MNAFPKANVFVGKQVFPPDDDGGTFVILSPARQPNTVLACISVFKDGLPAFNAYLNGFYERIEEHENMAFYEVGGDLVRQYNGFSYRRLE